MFQKTIQTLHDFIRLEAFGGVLLLIMAVLALLVANCGWHEQYHQVLHAYFGPHLGIINLKQSVLHWINDGLMALFFLLVGLEIKGAVLEDGRQGLRRLIFPGVAAIGGMLVPGLIFVACAWHDKLALKAWAIPTATDIAFSLGILILLGERVSVSLKLFLTTLAIVDDLGAILIIAFFYTAHIHSLALALAGVCFLLLLGLNVLRVQRLAVYLAVGVILWACLLKSGVHATIAGVLLALVIPLRDKQGRLEQAPSHRLEQRLHPWVVYVILPIFAFANAGVSFHGMSISALWQPMTLGILLGLLFGKQIGIFLFSYLGVKLGLTRLPDKLDWWQVYGVGVLCGIGFTMSLFIGMLAFDGNNYYDNLVRIGVFLASIISGAWGFAILRWRFKRSQ